MLRDTQCKGGSSGANGSSDTCATGFGSIQETLGWVLSGVGCFIPCPPIQIRSEPSSIFVVPQFMMPHFQYGNGPLIEYPQCCGLYGTTMDAKACRSTCPLQPLPLKHQDVRLFSKPACRTFLPVPLSLCLVQPGQPGPRLPERESDYTVANTLMLITANGCHASGLQH